MIHWDNRRTGRLWMLRRRAFSILEVFYAMLLFSVVLMIAVPPMRDQGFAARVRDTAFVDELKGAIIDQRMRSLKEPTIGHTFVIDGKGAVRFNRSAICYHQINDPLYRVYIQPGAWVQVLTLPDFRNRLTTGQDGFTIAVWRNDRIIARLIFQVGTSTFREEYYGP